MYNMNTKANILKLLEQWLSTEEYLALTHYLDVGGFWTAPYSTKYQYCYMGGLADYSLATYKTLCTLCEEYDEKYEPRDLLLVGLFHCIAKSEYFERCVNNQKVYSQDGNKFDELGPYEWKSGLAFATRDVDKRYTAGGLGLTSYMILSRYVSLTEEAIMSIIYCFYDNDTRDIYTLLRRFPLISLLHCASTLTLNVGVKQCLNN